MAGEKGSGALRQAELFPDLPAWDAWEINLEIVGLGMILYSPPAIVHIRKGSNSLREHFWEPADVARHVMECQLTAFCTGSPGHYRVRFLQGPRNEEAVSAAAFKIRLGLQVQQGQVIGKRSDVEQREQQREGIAAECVASFPAPQFRTVRDGNGALVGGDGHQPGDGDERARYGERGEGRVVPFPCEERGDAGEHQPHAEDRQPHAEQHVDDIAVDRQRQHRGRAEQPGVPSAGLRHMLI